MSLVAGRINVICKPPSQHPSISAWHFILHFGFSRISDLQRHILERQSSVVTVTECRPGSGVYAERAYTRHAVYGGVHSRQSPSAKPTALGALSPQRRACTKLSTDSTSAVVVGAVYARSVPRAGYADYVCPAVGLAAQECSRSLRPSPSTAHSAPARPASKRAPVHAHARSRSHRQPASPCQPAACQPRWDVPRSGPLHLALCLLSLSLWGSHSVD